MPRTLNVGATGEDVRALQRLLNFHFPLPWWVPLTEDGIFGSKTRARVVEFQSVNNLLVDGIVGPQTRQTLLDSRTFSFNASIAPIAEELSPHKLQLSGGPNLAGSKAKQLPFVLAQATTPTTPGPSGAPSGPATLTQRTVQLQMGQQLSINPYFLSPLVITGQVSWLFRRNGLTDFTITAAGQFAFNQQSGPMPNGGWSGQGAVQWGPTGILKIGDFDLLNPFVTLMLQKNQGQPPSFGLGIGNQINWTLWSLPHPSIPNVDRRNLGLFVNGQLVTNTFLPIGTPPPGSLPSGQFSAPGVQILGGVSWTMDWTPKP
jgi:peptidoglycan hydrolase-like protein with peptidoglycan-binding domain